jgi:hypothetical protein
LKKIEGKKNVADMLTKVVTIDKLKLISRSARVIDQRRLLHD